MEANKVEADIRK